MASLYKQVFSLFATNKTWYKGLEIVYNNTYKVSNEFIVMNITNLILCLSVKYI